MSEQSETKPAAEAEKKDVLVTPEGEEIDLSIMGTMKIDPADYKSVSSNPNRLKSLKYAVAGMLYVLKREPSIQLATVITVIVVVVGLWLQVGIFSWALLTLALGAVWITECLNTAIEATIDMGSDAPHPMAKVGKDVASTASLVATIVFLIICALILLPRIIDRIN